MNIEFFSLEQQDEFIFNLFDGKRNGTFIDLACAHPIQGNNTYVLEKDLGWSGWCFDIVDVEQRDQWSKHRTSPFVKIDATSEEFSTYLKNNVPKDLVVDYISLDIDTASMAALARIVEAGIKFKSITFEHEYFKDPHLRTSSREVLESLGFKRLFEDVIIPSFADYYPGKIQVFEDWWINPDYIDPTILEIKTTGKFYRDNVEIIKSYKNLQYNGTHACCLSWPDEYRLFHNSAEEWKYRKEFAKMKK